MNNLPRVVAWQRRDRQSNPRSADRKSGALTITLPSNATLFCILVFNWLSHDTLQNDAVIVLLRQATLEVYYHGYVRADESLLLRGSWWVQPGDLVA